MFSKAGIIFGLMAALALAAGCSDDDSDKQKDKGLPGQEAGAEATVGYEATVGPEATVGQEGTVGYEAAVGEALPAGSYGATCVPGATNACSSGMLCIGISGGSTSKGFCSKICTGTSDTSCNTGVPTGTYSLCALKSPTKSDAGADIYYCAFICEYTPSTYPCPPGLTCKASGTTGIKLCFQ